MESKNTFSLLALIDNEPEEVMPTDSLAHDITDEARELFFQNFFSIMSRSIEELLKGFFQLPPDDQTNFLIQQFGQHAHPSCYDTYAKHTLAPTAFMSFLFNFSEQVAIMSFAPAAAFLEKNLEALPDSSTTTAEEVAQDNMEITVDTNQQSSRIIPEDTPAPIPDQASSLMLTSKPGNDKSGAKKLNDQPKKGKDTPRQAKSQVTKIPRRSLK
ncbi:hypothetical protein RCL_jg23828.t1 [Rhizophagus clarus]|uniref:Uncharacterized protein n=1 Tax=Rhizophagus clarus TaxID=94130 RepID=A0A8H3LK51_9GLOM|nr:hypothetical protein RCL_jg23828.t1 [Rhizophagus clarus]